MKGDLKFIPRVEEKSNTSESIKETINIISIDEVTIKKMKMEFKKCSHRSSGINKGGSTSLLV